MGSIEGQPGRRALWLDEAGGRRDGRQAGDRTHAEPHQRGPTQADPLDPRD